MLYSREKRSLCKRGWVAPTRRADLLSGDPPRGAVSTTHPSFHFFLYDHFLLYDHSSSLYAVHHPGTKVPYGDYLQVFLATNYFMIILPGKLSHSHQCSRSCCQWYNLQSFLSLSLVSASPCHLQPYGTVSLRQLVSLQSWARVWRRQKYCFRSGYKHNFGPRTIISCLKTFPGIRMILLCSGVGRSQCIT